MKFKHLSVAALAIITVHSTSLFAADGPVKTTVEGVFQQKEALKNQTVQVTGKVVKATLGVMQKNFYHIQDGTGAAGTNDITVTSLDTAAVGDEVTVTGSLVTDLDFGAGYTYPILIEKATLTRAGQ